MEWKLTLFDVAKATGGKHINCDENEIVKGVSTDSRAIDEGCIFVALAGEKFNGHRFALAAVDAGAICAVVNEDEQVPESVPRVVVSDTYTALRDIAEEYRSRFHLPVVGVTGSVGKTSTKDMIASVLAVKYNTHKTSGNFNNEIGLPLTVFSISDSHEICVLEMGMSAPGEISRLTKIAKPDIAVITNIGVSHIENLGSREGILEAKLEILEGLVPDGVVILNADDDLLFKVKDEIEFETLTFGIENKEADITAEDIKLYPEGSEFTVRLGGENARMKINVPGKHNIYNALAATLVGCNYNMNLFEIAEGVKNFKAGGLRQSVLELKNGCVLIKDCYNASPQSMQSGLDVLLLSECQGRRIACLADMLELGEISEQAHLDVGKMAASKGIDCLITIGHMAKFIAAGALNNGFSKDNIYTAENNTEAIKIIDEILQPGDCVLVKGSRGMHLEEVADYIANK